MVCISGIGIIGAFGRGLYSLESALMRKNVIEPIMVEVHGIPDKVPVLSVKQEDLKDKALSRKMRRADRFTKMAVLAAADALSDSSLAEDEIESSSMGIILSTGYGPHATTFEFLDGYLDYGEAAVSPTSFSHSVHNAAASYISNLFGIRGPTQTITDFNYPFQNALQLAVSWLNEDRCENVLIGSVDELGQQMEYVFSRVYPYANTAELSEDSRDKIFIPGEGAVFFVLSKSNIKGECNISCHITDRHLSEKADVKILDIDVMLDNLSLSDFNKSLYGYTETFTNYSGIFGDMKIATAFHTAIASLMLNNQCIYSSDNKKLSSFGNTELNYQKRAINSVLCIKPMNSVASAEVYVSLM